MTDAPGIPAHATPPAPAVHTPDTLALIARPLAPDRPPWLDEVSGLEPPSWYERCRASLHTRLSPRWREREVFRNAAQAFRDLGARHRRAAHAQRRIAMLMRMHAARASRRSRRTQR